MLTICVMVTQAFLCFVKWRALLNQSNQTLSFLFHVRHYKANEETWLCHNIPERISASSPLSLYLKWIEEQQSPGNSEGGRQWQQPPVTRYRADKWLISHRDRGKVSGSTVAEWNAKSSRSLSLTHTDYSNSLLCMHTDYTLLHYVLLYYTIL